MDIRMENFFWIEIDNERIVNNIVNNKIFYLEKFYLNALELPTVNVNIKNRAQHSSFYIVSKNNDNNCLNFCEYISKTFSTYLISLFKDNYFIFDKNGKYIKVNSRIHLGNDNIKDIFKHFSNTLNVSPIKKQENLSNDFFSDADDFIASKLLKFNNIFKDQKLLFSKMAKQLPYHSEEFKHEHQNNSFNKYIDADIYAQAKKKSLNKDNTHSAIFSIDLDNKNEISDDLLSLVKGRIFSDIKNVSSSSFDEIQVSLDDTENIVDNYKKGNCKNHFDHHCRCNTNESEKFLDVSDNPIDNAFNNKSFFESKINFDNSIINEKKIDSESAYSVFEDPLANNEIFSNHNETNTFDDLETDLIYKTKDSHEGVFMEDKFYTPEYTVYDEEINKSDVIINNEVNDDYTYNDFSSQEEDDLDEIRNIIFPNTKFDYIEKIPTEKNDEVNFNSDFTNLNSENIGNEINDSNSLNNFMPSIEKYDDFKILNDIEEDENYIGNNYEDLDAIRNIMFPEDDSDDPIRFLSKEDLTADSENKTSDIINSEETSYSDWEYKLNSNEEEFLSTVSENKPTDENDLDSTTVIEDDFKNDNEPTDENGLDSTTVNEDDFKNDNEPILSIDRFETFLSELKEERKKLQVDRENFTNNYINSEK